MANVRIEKQYLQDIADIIREKTGSTSKYKVSDMDEEISKISGGTSGGVKLFETIEEMNNDPDAHEDDLAVVYRSEVTNCTASSQFSQATFPATVVLSEAVTDYIDISFRAVDESSGHFDCYGDLHSSSFYMDCYGDNGSYRVQYTSEDGLTYTRTKLQDPNGDVSGDSLDFGQEIKYGSNEQYWNDVIGEFIKVGGVVFEGLFEYKLNNKTDTFRFPLLSGLDTLQAKYNPIFDETVFNSTELKNILESLSSWYGSNYGFYLTDTDKLVFPYFVESPSNSVTRMDSLIYGDDGFENNFLGRTTSTIRDNEFYINVYDINTNTLTKYTYTPELVIINELEFYKFPDNITEDIGNIISLPVAIYNEFTPTTIYWRINYSSSLSSLTPGTDLYIYKDQYINASTQLTLSSSNQLLPGKIALGKNGIITGDASLYDNLDGNEVLENFFKFDKMENQSCSYYKGLNDEGLILSYSNSNKDVFGKIQYYKQVNPKNNYNQYALIRIPKSRVHHNSDEFSKYYNNDKTKYIKGETSNDDSYIYQKDRTNIVIYNSDDSVFKTITTSTGKIIYIDKDRGLYFTEKGTSLLFIDWNGNKTVIWSGFGSTSYNTHINYYVIGPFFFSELSYNASTGKGYIYNMLNDKVLFNESRPSLDGLASELHIKATISQDGYLFMFIPRTTASSPSYAGKLTKDFTVKKINIETGNLEGTYEIDSEEVLGSYIYYRTNFAIGLHADNKIGFCPNSNIIVDLSNRTVTKGTFIPFEGVSFSGVHYLIQYKNNYFYNLSFKDCKKFVGGSYTETGNTIDTEYCIGRLPYAFQVDNFYKNYIGNLRDIDDFNESEGLLTINNGSFEFIMDVNKDYFIPCTKEESDIIVISTRYESGNSMTKYEMLTTLDGV